ncbi:hypothetical protein ACNSPG_06505 [Brucella pituitosa]|uniref:hypothetical protein n=1 Tax=Brucella pituitosa TaxID=571256 RepID=UPI003C724722
MVGDNFSKKQLIDLMIEAVVKHLEDAPFTGVDTDYTDLEDQLPVNYPVDEMDGIFSKVVTTMRDYGQVTYNDHYSGVDTEAVFTDLRLTDAGKQEHAHLMSNSQISNTTSLSASKLNELKNKAILYTYEHGAGSMNFQVPADDVMKHLGVSGPVWRQVTALLMAQGFWHPKTFMSNVGLSDKGQQEAERLGPLTRLIQPAVPSQNVIDARYSIVQIAGDNSTQSAQQTIDQSALTQILNDIDQELERVPIDPTQKKEAQGLVAALRGYAGKAFDAAGRAISGVLASILTAAGSELGQSLLKLIGTAV